MAQTYIKTKSGDYDVSDLQHELNDNLNIVPSCLSVSGDDDQLTLEFAAALSAGEETELDSVIASHVPSPDTINAVKLPFSSLDDNKKLSVHSSNKPRVDGITTYSVWTGSGDHSTTGDIGGGDLLDFHMEVAGGNVTKDMKFDQDQHGRVWIHEGYLKFSGGGQGDHLSADVVSYATPLQTSTGLDLEITDDWIKYAAGGAGTGTHGWDDADKIVLIPRTYSKDGDWDWDGQTLTPNAGGTGDYKISTTERVVHRYINKIPCCGSCNSYFSMTSNETTELKKGYYLKIVCYNVSNTAWEAEVVVEIYRERTNVP